MVEIDPDSSHPVKITYYYSRRRNMTIRALLCDELYLDDVSIGMAVKWTSNEMGQAVIVGPIPERPHIEQPPPMPEPNQITKVTVTVENEVGEILTYSLDEGDWNVDNGLLQISSFHNVSALLPRIYSEKPVMFITHISPDSLQTFEPYMDESEFRVWRWNYVFPDFPIWGDYFSYQTSDPEVTRKLGEFSELGFRNILYVDPTESHGSVSYRWADSVIESDDWWSLMTLNPSKSWYHYLKEGMLDLTRRFPTIDGFAIDRLDRCQNTQEEAWAAQLLDEVQQEASIPVRYVMNSLQPWMTELASRAAFIGSDGVTTDEPHLSRAIEDYRNLAAHTELKTFYINPYMGLTDDELLRDFSRILERHDFIFMDDYYSRLLPPLFLE
ncbi:hypothetical protein HQ586_08630 [Candidatus Bathyarchaeota archaeon]|nr:hypothetical protein [Candidatus Bathyarchaeota archaeon]